jgi:hypothetical protein
LPVQALPKRQLREAVPVVEVKIEYLFKLLRDFRLLVFDYKVYLIEVAAWASPCTSFFFAFYAICRIKIRIKK